MAIGQSARYVCGDEERRAAIRRAIAGGVAINGIDFVEVIDRELEGTSAEDSRQRILLVQCFATGLGGLGVDHVRVEGGVRVTPVHVRWVATLDAITPGAPSDVPAVERQFLANYRLGDIDRNRILAVGTEERGDYSTYRIALVEPGETTPVAGFDPRLAAVDFSFKVECPSDFDCKPTTVCPPGVLTQPRHRLPLEGLPELPPADARPDGGHRPRLEGAQPGRPGRRAGRAAKVPVLRLRLPASVTVTVTPAPKAPKAKKNRRVLARAAGQFFTQEENEG